MSYKQKWLRCYKYKLSVVTKSPLAVKGDEGIIQKDVLTNRFLIPGSSIAGAFKNYYDQYIEDGTETLGLFANKENDLGTMNGLYCFDSVERKSNETAKLSSRAGLRINPETLTGATSSDDKQSGSKFSRVFIGEGAKFDLVFELNQFYEEQDFNQMEKQWVHLLSAFVRDEIPLGGHKQIGFGLFEVKDITVERYDMTTIKGAKDFVLDRAKEESILAEVSSIKGFSHKVVLELKARSTTPLLVKDDEIHQHGSPDSMNIINSQGDYVIPGSSLKGVIRGRADKIIKTVSPSQRSLIERLFGTASAKESFKSSVNCLDVIIEKQKADTEIYHRIAIDHFTGGVSHGALMSEEVIMGDVNFKVILEESSRLDEKAMKQGIGLLLLVLKELASEELTIGSGYAIGRGYFKGIELKLETNKSYVYNFATPQQEIEQVFDDYIAALWED